MFSVAGQVVLVDAAGGWLSGGGRSVGPVGAWRVVVRGGRFVAVIRMKRGSGPLPALLLVADEYAALLRSHPDVVDLMDRVAGEAQKMGPVVVGVQRVRTAPARGRRSTSRRRGHRGRGPRGARW